MLSEQDGLLNVEAGLESKVGGVDLTLRDKEQKEGTYEL